jgi:putative polyhydroxyalkanoate system protein
MPKYEVDIPHGLSPEEAKQRLAGATSKLQNNYGATCTWKSDNELSVSRKGLDARVTVEPARVHIDLNLGFLLTPFAEKIKSGIAKELSGILAAPATAI